MEPTIDDLKELQAKFKEYYNEGGLVGIDDNRIHVDKTLFKKLCVGLPVVIEWCCGDMHIKAVVDGITFVTLI